MKKLSELTIEDKILEWLQINRKSTVTTGELRRPCAMWMERKYGMEGVNRTDRTFRDMKSTEVPGKPPVLKVTELEGCGKNTTWRIDEVLINGEWVPWNQLIGA